MDAAKRRLLDRRLFWPAWAAAAVLFAVMCGFAAATDYFPGDPTIAHRIQDFDDFGFGPLAAFANTAGDMLPAALITVAFGGVFLFLGRSWESALVFLTFIPRAMRQGLAAAVARPRPSADILQIRDHAAGFSFPSGHVTGAVVLYGALFVVAGALVPHSGLRLLFRGLCVAMIVLTCLARVYVGVHWPSDVVGGCFFGLLVMAPLYLFYRERI